MTDTSAVRYERDSDGMFVASVPALTGCHTQAPSREEVMIRIKEAIALHLEDQDQDKNVEFWASSESYRTA